MGLVRWIKKLLPGRKKNLLACGCKKDEAKIILPGLFMSMERPANFQVPHEVSLFVPRAELRKTIKEEGKTTTFEVIFNSITMVHAPRHPLAGETPSSPPAPPTNS